MAISSVTWVLLMDLWSGVVSLFYLPVYQCTELGYFDIAKETSGVGLGAAGKARRSGRTVSPFSAYKPAADFRTARLPNPAGKSPGSEPGLFVCSQGRERPPHPCIFLQGRRPRRRAGGAEGCRTRLPGTPAAPAARLPSSRAS